MQTLKVATVLALAASCAATAAVDSITASPSEFWETRHNLRGLAGQEEKVACVRDEDCTDHPFYVCGAKTEGFCGHKEVFPVQPMEIGGIIIFALIMALSNIAGIGGGGVAIPIIMAFFYFSTKPAIAISSLSIFLTTLARFIMNFREKHPEKENVVVIDYDLVTIMMPTTLAGAQIGAIVLVVFPSIIIQIILTLMLGFLAVQSAFKAWQITKKENAAKQEDKTNNVQPVVEEADSMRRPVVVIEQKLELSDLRTPGEAPSPNSEKQENSDRVGGNQRLRAFSAGTELNSVPSKQSEKESSDAGRDPALYEGGVEEAVNPVVHEVAVVDKDLKFAVSDDMDKQEIEMLRSQVKSESSHFQWAKQGMCVFLLACLVLMNLCMGSSSQESIIGISKCGAAYWGIQIAFLAICAVLAVTAVKLARRDQQLKLKYGGINVSQSDIRYDNKKRLGTLLILGFAGGWVAGALGLGGGCIYNPALLALGIPPKVSSATGLYLVTFSKIASVLIYYLNDQLDVPYGLWIGLWSCLGMIVGLVVTQYYMKKTGRQSIIVWCLVVIFVVSVVAIPIFGGLSLKKEQDEGLDLMAFQSLCDA